MIHIGSWTPTIQELVFLATTLWTGAKWLMARMTLPKEVQSILNQIGQTEVESFIVQAAGFPGKTDLEKRAMVAAEIVTVAKQELKIDVPNSFADMIVGFVWARLYSRKAVRVD